MVKMLIIVPMSQISTEEKIKDAARKVFIQKGMSGARMQEIANEAGINKALLHYYYRSKEQLFNSVFEETLLTFIPQLFQVFNSDLPFEVKIYQVAEKYIGFLSEHREIPIFILNEIQKNPALLARKMQMSRGNFAALESQLNEEIEKGNIRPISIEMFTLNLISMMVFPFLGGALFEHVMGMEEGDLDALIELRKTEVPKFFLNALKP